LSTDLRRRWLFPRIVEQGGDSAGTLPGGPPQTAPSSSLFLVDSGQRGTRRSRWTWNERAAERGLTWREHDCRGAPRTGAGAGPPADY